MSYFDAAIAVAVVLATETETDFPTRIDAKWSKNWFLQHSKFGNAELLLEQRHNEPQDFQNFLRMDFESFNELLPDGRTPDQKANYQYAWAYLSYEMFINFNALLGHGKYF